MTKQDKPQPRTHSRTIAIGDIHGCAVELADLLRQIDPQPDDTIITLGDYVNRGPDTRGVIEQLIALSKCCQLIPLLGNHDDVLLQAIDGRGLDFLLAQGGGQATLDSYGPGSQLGDIPSDHIQFLRSCRKCFETDTHLFAHANYDPNRRLADTDWNTLLWRKLEPPYPGPHFWGKRVIVGHTAQRNFQVLDLGHVVCIDTGCCHGGVLTALDLESRRSWRTSEPSIANGSERSQSSTG